MKRLLLALVFCASAGAFAKTKYICAVRTADSSYITEFESLDECRKYCDVCEETEVAE